MSFNFSKENLEKIQQLKKRYPSPKALALPCLWMAQYQDGFISIDAIDVISEQTTIPPMEIYRVATFYTMFNTLLLFQMSPADKPAEDVGKFGAFSTPFALIIKRSFVADCQIATGKELVLTVGLN